MENELTNLIQLTKLMNKYYLVKHPTEFGRVEIHYPTLAEAEDAQKLLEEDGYEVTIEEIRN